MSVDTHPSRKPSPPRKPPATSTTSGEANKETHSGQAGVPYGFRHEINVKNPNRSEMAAHFASSKEAPNEPASRKAQKASRPGDEA
jgi:hypothetical protein